MSSIRRKAIAVVVTLVGAAQCGCGSADSATSFAGGGARSGAGGSDSGVAPATGGTAETGGAGGAFESGAGGSFLAGGAGGTSLDTGGASGAPVDAGHDASSSAEAGPVPIVFPAGGVISGECARCANEHCQPELSACHDSPGCWNIGVCITQCFFPPQCAACFLADQDASTRFNTLQCCSTQECGILCPSLNGGVIGCQ